MTKVCFVLWHLTLFNKTKLCQARKAKRAWIRRKRNVMLMMRLLKNRMMAMRRAEKWIMIPSPAKSVLLRSKQVLQTLMLEFICSEPDPESKLDKDMKSVAEEDALRKLLTSDEDEEEEKKSDEDEDNKKKEEKEKKKTKKLNKDEKKGVADALGLLSINSNILLNCQTLPVILARTALTRRTMRHQALATTKRNNSPRRTTASIQLRLSKTQATRIRDHQRPQVLLAVRPINAKPIRACLAI